MTKILEITPCVLDARFKLKGVLTDNGNIVEVVAANDIRAIKSILQSCGHSWDVIDDRRKTFNLTIVKGASL